MDEQATQSGASDLDDAAALFDAADEAVEQQEVPQEQEQERQEEELELDGEQESQEVTEDPEIELKIDGETRKVKQSQLIADAQKYHAANKKFEEAAALRKEYETKSAQIPEQEKQLNHVLTHYIQQSQAMMGQEPDWRALLSYDQQNGTRNYEMARLDWEGQQRELMQAQQTKQMLDQRESEALAASNSERLKGEQARLIEAIPDWKDPTKAAEGAKAIDNYLSSQGIPAEVRGSLDSAAVVLIARKAMLYDQAIARRQQAQTTTKQAAPVARPGVSEKATPQTQVQRMNAGKAFKANPTVDNLAAFFE